MLLIGCTVRRPQSHADSGKDPGIRCNVRPRPPRVGGPVDSSLPCQSPPSRHTTACRLPQLPSTNNITLRLSGMSRATARVSNRMNETISDGGGLDDAGTDRHTTPELISDGKTVLLGRAGPEVPPVGIGWSALASACRCNLACMTDTPQSAVTRGRDWPVAACHENRLLLYCRAHTANDRSPVS